MTYTKFPISNSDHSLVIALNQLYWLERFEPLNFAIAYDDMRISFRRSINAWRRIYKGYKALRGTN